MDEGPGRDRIRRNIQRIRQSTAALARECSVPEPTLVVASKGRTVDEIRAVYDEGLVHFGENQVQELRDKVAQFPRDVRWHFIGALQANKIKTLAQMRELHMVQTVDSVDKAVMLDCFRKSLPRLNVMVQVNTSGEGSKRGSPVESAVAVAEFIARQCWNLRFRGFMTIGSLASSQNADRNQDFEKLVALRARCMQALQLEDAPMLSMGMSSDYKLAIRMGTSMLRLGSLVFGEPLQAHQQ